MRKNLLIFKGDRRSSIKSLAFDGFQLAGGTSIANMFNKYFSTIIYAKLDAETSNFIQCPLQYLDNDISSLIFLNPLSESECSHIISRMKPTYHGR